MGKEFYDKKYSLMNANDKEKLELWLSTNNCNVVRITIDDHVSMVEGYDINDTNNGEILLASKNKKEFHVISIVEGSLIIDSTLVKFTDDDNRLFEIALVY